MSILKLITEVEVLLIYHQILITYLQGENHQKRSWEFKGY